MSCIAIEVELCAYHFGVVSDEVRRDVEAHLCECASCLRAFLDVKRAIETDEGSSRPAPSARDRLRRDVARELSTSEPRRARTWWERPVAFTFAGSAVLAAMIAMHVLTSGPGEPPYQLSSGHGAARSNEPPR